MRSPDRQLRHLHLEVRDNGGTVTILIDEQELFASVSDRSYEGFHPAQMLDPDAMVLLPVAPERRVAVYRCGCGIAGCGCIAPFVSQTGKHVRWTDFRDFTGVYDGPAVDDNPAGGMALPLPDLVFDADQYRAEVERAAGDRWWETPQLKAARLARRVLSDRRSYLAGLGWAHEHLWPADDRGTFTVTFLDPEDNQICVDITPSPGAPEHQAQKLADLLLTTTPEQWPVTHCSLCDYDFEPSPGESWHDRIASLARHPAHGPTNRSRLDAQRRSRGRDERS
jgi:hypothetical protein